MPPHSTKIIISSLAIQNNTPSPVSIYFPSGANETVESQKSSGDLSSTGEYTVLDKFGVQQFSAELYDESFITTLGSANGEFVVSIKLK
jgi:hypothetical protein